MSYVRAAGILLDGANGRTRDVLHTIERIGRSALTEMRRLLGMLRSGAAERWPPAPARRPAHAPQPGS